MRTIEKTVYKFSELSGAARDNARQQAMIDIGYSWSEEAIDSIKALARYFDGKVKDYELDWFNSSYSQMSFDMGWIEEKEVLKRLKSLGAYDKKTLKGSGECKLTGVCHDEDAIDGFRIAWFKGERDLNKLMQAAFDSWLKAAQADCESQYKDDQMSENSEVNGYEYYENGEMV